MVSGSDFPDQSNELTEVSAYDWPGPNTGTPLSHGTWGRLNLHAQGFTGIWLIYIPIYFMSFPITYQTLWFFTNGCLIYIICSILFRHHLNCSIIISCVCSPNLVEGNIWRKPRYFGKIHGFLIKCSLKPTLCP
jgi:hypothetical protein